MAGRKDDSDKPRFDLIPPEAELEIARVLAFGAAKYGPENWRLVPNAKQRYEAARARHINALRRGEKFDPESNFHHRAHAICCDLFILELELQEAGTRIEQPQAPTIERITIHSPGALPIEEPSWTDDTVIGPQDGSVRCAFCEQPATIVNEQALCARCAAVERPTRLK